MARQVIPKYLTLNFTNERNQPYPNNIAEGDSSRYLKMASQVFKPYELAREARTPYSTVTLDDIGKFVINEYSYGESISTDGSLSEQTESQFQKPGDERSAVVVSPNAFGVSIETLQTNAFMSDLSLDKLNQLINQSSLLKEKLESEFPTIFKDANFVENILSNEKYREILSEKLVEAAIEEHKEAGEKLRKAGVNVDFFDSPPGCPDAVYPNNWASTVVGRDGKKYLFISSMLNLSRQAERNQQVLKDLIGKFKPNEIVDLSSLEGRDAKSIRKYTQPLDKADPTDHKSISKALDEMENNPIQPLEGTGVFVYAGPFAIAIRSPRASKKLLEAVCKITGHELICVDAFDKTTVGDTTRYSPYYHTNVFAASGVNDKGKTVVVMCLESIEDKVRREEVKKQLENGGCELIEITRKQVAEFGGNIYQFTNDKDKKVWYMSKTARTTFTEQQRKQLGGEIVDVDIPLIEFLGGSARCTVLGTQIN